MQAIFQHGNSSHTWASATVNITKLRVLALFVVTYFTCGWLWFPVFLLSLVGYIFWWGMGTGWLHLFYPDKQIGPFRFQLDDIMSDERLVRLTDVSNSPLIFKDRTKYAMYGIPKHDKRKIPFLAFVEGYRTSEIDLKPGSDLQDELRKAQNWSYNALTLSYLKFVVLGYLPDVIRHTRKQDEDQVKEHYNRGNDFFNWFLGPTMCYTSGYYLSTSDSVETAQYQKIRLVLNKAKAYRTFPDGRKLRHLDLGTGWGTLVCYASKHFNTDSMGISLSEEGIKYCQENARGLGVFERTRFEVADYRDMGLKAQSHIGAGNKYDVITCLEMAEHVGIKNFSSFLSLVMDNLADDGYFYLQIAGLRENPKMSDLAWGVFMNRYIFPGADASMPLGWVIHQLELAGFEVHSVETIGVHYADTIKSWYNYWLSNKTAAIAKYGEQMYRTWELFLAWSSITPEQGSCTCYQIVSNKNLNAFDRRKDYFAEGKRNYDFDGKSAAI